MLGPGEEATVHGKIYFFAGDLDDVAARYVRDFQAHSTGSRLAGK